MSEGNGIDFKAGPVQVNATGDRSIQAAMLLLIIMVVVGGFAVQWNEHMEIRQSIDRLTLATVTTDEDKRSVIGGHLRDQVKEEVRKAAETAVRNTR